MIMNYHIYLRMLGYVVTIAMHVSNVAVMASSFHGELMNNKHVKHFSEMQLFFFTCWTFTFQTVHAIFGLCTDILTLKNAKCADYKPPKLLEFCRNTLFSTLVWPSTVLVFTMFWSFFYYDRSLLFPADIDMVISRTSNHVMHSCIFPATLWEVLFRRRKSPRTHRWNLAGLMFTALFYFSVVIAVHEIKGVWVYPIFGVLMGSIYFYLFVASVLAVLPVIYYAQWSVISMVWGSRDNPKKIF